MVEIMLESNLSKISYEVVEQMKKDIMEVLTGYKEIDIEHVNVDIFTPSDMNQQSMLIVANLPFKDE